MSVTLQHIENILLDSQEFMVIAPPRFRHIENKTLSYHHGERRQNEHFISQQQRFFDIVSNHDDGFTELTLKKEEMLLEASSCNRVEG